jgi:predicted transcriptional regulator
MATRWETVALRLEPAAMRRIEALASHYRITISAVARLALEHGLDRAEQELERQARQAS